MFPELRPPTPYDFDEELEHRYASRKSAFLNPRPKLVQLQLAGLRTNDTILRVVFGYRYHLTAELRKHLKLLLAR